MKTRIIFLQIAVSAILMAAVSCKKDDDNKIFYPLETEYGLNILNDSITVINANVNTKNYALTAILGSKSSLKVVMSMDGTCNFSGGIQCSTYWWVWDSFPIQAINWTATEYSVIDGNCTIPGGHLQVFTAKPGAECNLRIQFALVQFSCIIKMEIYENNSTEPDKIRYLTLKY